MIKTTKLQRIILVHGALHGAWCWEELMPLLVKLGYEVTAIDLPGSGLDPTPPSAVTLQRYIGRVVETVAEKTSPVLLVGHSMGGMPISGAAEAIPEKIGKLVYLAALMPKDGETMPEASGAAPALSAMRPGAIEGTIEFDLSVARKLFYHRCTPEVASRAATMIRPQASAPFTEQISLTAARFGTVPKTYIVCELDRALTPEHQHWLCSRDASVNKRSLNTDHSPFFSDVNGLATILHEEACY